jgi:acylphosphatase
VTGWVRNTDDGKVEAVFQGEESVVDDMIQWCYTGSPLSKVTKVESTVVDTDEIFDDFQVRYD